MHGWLLPGRPRVCLTRSPDGGVFHVRSGASLIPECPSTWLLLQRCPHYQLPLSKGNFHLASPSSVPGTSSDVSRPPRFYHTGFPPPYHSRPLFLHARLQT